jgi:glutathione S-transferase
MQIFGFPLSPFVRKVHLVAAEKGIEVETVLFHPADPPAEFIAASPFRKIPAMKDGDYTLADSTAIVTYIEAKHPAPTLIPADPQARGKAIWFEEFADTILTPTGGKIVFNRFVGPKFMGLAGDEEAALQGEKDLEPILAYLDGVAPAQGWLAGEAFSIGDIAVASTLRTLGYVDWAPDAAKHPATAAWYARVTARPAWQAVAEREQAILSRRLAAA